jgi:hypothetical protein
MAATGARVTQLLKAWSEGDQAALAAFDARQKSWCGRELSLEAHGG